MSDTPIVEQIDYLTVYRASALGYCPNAFLFARQGHPKRIPPNMQTAFDYGKDNEAKVLDILKRRGYVITGQGRETLLAITPTLKVRGHIDALTSTWRQTPLPPTLIEVKCLNSENTEHFRDDPEKWFPNYMLQVSAYYHSLPVDQILFAVYDKDAEELFEVHYQDPPVSLEAVKERVMYLESTYQMYQQSDILQPCVTFDSFCPYYYLHDTLPKAELQRLDDTQLTALLNLHQRLAREISDKELNKKKIDERLKVYMTAKGYDKGIAGPWQFNFQSIISYRLDTRKVTKYLKDQKVYDQYTTPQSTQRLTVTEADDLD